MNPLKSYVLLYCLLASFALLAGDNSSQGQEEELYREISRKLNNHNKKSAAINTRNKAGILFIEKYINDNNEPCFFVEFNMQKKEFDINNKKSDKIINYILKQCKNSSELIAKSCYPEDLLGLSENIKYPSCPNMTIDFLPEYSERRVRKTVTNAIDNFNHTIISQKQDEFEKRIKSAGGDCLYDYFGNKECFFKDSQIIFNNSLNIFRKAPTENQIKIDENSVTYRDSHNYDEMMSDDKIAEWLNLTTLENCKIVKGYCDEVYCPSPGESIYCEISLEQINNKDIKNKLPNELINFTNKTSDLLSKLCPNDEDCSKDLMSIKYKLRNID